MRSTGNKGRTAFSLVELVIVVVIIGTIAAIAVPRMTQASRNAAESALSRDLAVLRSSIELYASEHNGVYPGQQAAGGAYGSAGTAEAFTSQLTLFSGADGKVATKRDNDHPFGPYLRKGIPPLPVGKYKGNNAVKMEAGSNELSALPATIGYGWVYNPKTGEIVANSDDTDSTTSETYTNY